MIVKMIHDDEMKVVMIVMMMMMMMMMMMVYMHTTHWNLYVTDLGTWDGCTYHPEVRPDLKYALITLY